MHDCGLLLALSSFVSCLPPALTAIMIFLAYCPLFFALAASVFPLVFALTAAARPMYRALLNRLTVLELLENPKHTVPYKQIARRTEKNNFISGVEATGSNGSTPSCCFCDVVKLS